MKILVVSNSPLDERQGSGYVILNFCKGLRERGHEVDLLGPDDCIVFEFLKKGRSYRLTVGMLIATIRQLAKKSYDIVEFYGAQAWLAVSVLSALPKRDFLLISHSNGLESYCNEMLLKYLGFTSLEESTPQWYQRDQTPLLEKAFRDVDGIVTVSDDDRDYALEHGYQDAAHVLSIQNCLPNEYLGLTCDFDRPPVVGFCGSWLLRKGTPLIEAVIPKILHEFPQCQFKLIGVGPRFRNDIELSPADRQRLQIIPFADKTTELKDLYQSLSIFIMPSFYEGFGMVAAEAMACGCALVATRSGFAYSLADGRDVVIVEPNAESLYEGIKRLLLDEQLRKRMAIAGYGRVQKLRWDRAIGTLDAAYSDWLANHRSKKSLAASVLKKWTPWLVC